MAVRSLPSLWIAAGSTEAVSVTRRVLAVSVLLGLFSVAPLMAADATIHLSVDASKTGPKIDRNLFGQFAENLGHGLYEGLSLIHI